MTRRSFLQQLLAAASLPAAASLLLGRARAGQSAPLKPAPQDWRSRWEKSILAEAGNRYCDREVGEELGWLVSPFLNGFYHGFLATGDAAWVRRLADWTEAWTRRGIEEPDGYLGWPKSGTGGAVATDLLTDSLLGEAMALRPAVLMAAEVLKNPELKPKFTTAAQDWIKLAERVFEKWLARGCWRPVENGGVWVVPGFGIDRQTNQWTSGYARRQTEGFSNPANKQNHIARWLLAMHQVTGKPVYRDHARKWWQVMKSRMKPRENGNYFVWDYWAPAGPWDFKADGSPRHWVGVHPNGGYYAIDVEGIVDAFEHGLVFDRGDIDRLVATNRDFMWNQQLSGAHFRRIDGGTPDPRWKDSPGVLWTSLVSYDRTLRDIFLTNHNPAGWGGLAATPWFLARERTAG